MFYNNALVRVCNVLLKAAVHNLLTELGLDRQGTIKVAPYDLEPILRLLNVQLQRQRCSRLQRFSK
jgi:hypothetical protein